MYHQCLNCGAVYARGSVDVINGCRECGMSKFSFTRNPLPREELLELKRISNDDLGVLMRDILNHNLSVSKLSKDEKKLVGKDSGGWVKVRVEDSTALPGKDKEPAEEKPMGDPLEDVPGGLGISDGDSLDTFLRPKEDVSAPSTAPSPDTDQRKRKGPSWGKRVRIESTSVEVVRETEEGVYEIDLGRMIDSVLHKLPVVMLKNGIYLINLHSSSGEGPIER